MTVGYSLNQWCKLRTQYTRGQLGTHCTSGVSWVHSIPVGYTQHQWCQLGTWYSQWCVTVIALQCSRKAFAHCSYNFKSATERRPLGVTCRPCIAFCGLSAPLSLPPIASGRAAHKETHYTQTHTHMHTQTHTHVHTHTHTHTQRCAQTHTDTHMCTHIQTHRCAHTYTHIYMYTHTHTHTHAHTHTHKIIIILITEQLSGTVIHLWGGGGGGRMVRNNTGGELTGTAK